MRIGNVRVLLCGAYESIHTALQQPHRARADVTAVNRLRLTVSQYPDASPDVRAGIADDIAQLAAQIAPVE